MATLTLTAAVKKSDDTLVSSIMDTFTAVATITQEIHELFTLPKNTSIDYNFGSVTGIQVLIVRVLNTGSTVSLNLNGTLVLTPIPQVIGGGLFIVFGTVTKLSIDNDNTLDATIEVYAAG